MGKLMYQGIQYTGGGSEGESIIYMTKAEYDQITPEEDQLYGIVDWDSEAVALIKDGVIVNNATWSSQKMVNTFAQKTQISNPNLLDNGWFTINQRGFVDTPINNYTVDRWRTRNTTLVSLSNGIITVTHNRSDGATWFGQPLEHDYANFLVGKTVTLSILTGNDTLESWTFVVPNVGTSIDLPTKTVDGTKCYFKWEYTQSAICPYFWMPSSEYQKTLTLKAIKLEVGSISTLALDTAPNYATELLKCQRYFYRLNIQRYVSSTLCSSFEANRVQVPFKLPIQMRTTPSAILKNTSSVMVRKGGSSSLTVSNINSCYMNSDILTADFTATGAEAGSVYALYTNVDGGAYIDFTADL